MIAAITGALGGIGSEVAKSLEAAGHQVIRLSRSDGDLSMLASVAGLVDQLRSRYGRIDLLINNAAVGGRRGVTTEGFEPAFAVNYLSHFLITRGLVSTQTRVVNVSSEAHRSAPSIDPLLGLGRTRTPLGWREYAFSKACQIAFTIELAARGVDAYAAHPGVTATGLWRPVPQPLRWLIMSRMAPPLVGAIPVVRAALDRDLRPGAYVTPTGVIEPSSVATDRYAISRLWDQSERWVGPYLN